MDQEYEEYTLILPEEKPTFDVTVDSGKKKKVTVDSELYLVTVAMDKKNVSLIWTGRMPLKTPLRPDQFQELEAMIDIQLE